MITVVSKETEQQSVTEQPKPTWKKIPKTELTADDLRAVVDELNDLKRRKIMDIRITPESTTRRFTKDGVVWSMKITKHYMNRAETMLQLYKDGSRCFLPKDKPREMAKMFYAIKNNIEKFF